MTAAQITWAVHGMLLLVAGVVLALFGQHSAGGVLIGLSIVGYGVLGWMIWSDRRAPGPL